MKKQLLFLLITLLSLKGYAQISFEKGYYIDNDGQKVECFIWNIDWENNPSEFKYRLSEKDDSKIATIEFVKEFGVYNESKYVGDSVDMDRSSSSLYQISNVRNPIFKKEALFLKVLVEGKANLYEYKEGNLTRYFYSIDTSEIKQLIFKYYTNMYNKVRKNRGFRQQMKNELKCSTSALSNPEKLEYKKVSLVRFFVEYNECANQTFVNFEEIQQRDLFNLTVRPGLNISTLKIQNTLSASNITKISNKPSFRFGVEAEFIMPYNKNKWAFMVEPTFQYFKSTEDISSTNQVKADYKSIELPVGIRYYSFLNAHSKVFITAAYVLDFNLNSSIEFIPGSDLDVHSKGNLAFGAGYKHHDRFSLAFRYQFGRELFSNYLYWRSDYNTFSVIFGYSLF